MRLALDELLEKKKVYQCIIALMIILTLFELYWGYRVLIDYRMVYPFSNFVLFMQQPIWYTGLLLNRKKQRKAVPFLIIVLLSILYPLLIHFTLPDYTYEEGKQILLNSFAPNDAVTLVDFPDRKDIIPVTGNPKRFLVADLEYYFGVIKPNGTIYYAVNPLTGDIWELKEKYWVSDE